MARTHLLASVRRLLREHQLAQKTGLPIEEIRAGPYSTGGSSQARTISRREFIAGVAATTAVAMLPSVLKGNSWAAAPPRLAIIGGGIAGLTAALTLADAGLPSTVYEASETMIGGRMQTVRGRPESPSCGMCHEVKGKPAGFSWSDDQYTDPFGELIDTNHTTMLSLAKRFSLPLIDLIGAQPPGSTDTYYFLGQHYSKAQADADFAALYPKLRADLRAAGYPTAYNRSTPAGRTLDSMSIYDWIESRVEGGHQSPLGRLLDAAYNIEYGADTTDQSALNLIYLLAYNNPSRLSIYGESDERYRIDGGADLLPKTMAKYLGKESTVQLGWRLEAIARSGGSYILSFNDRREIIADLVVLALPFAVLRTLDYSKAGFDFLKIKAIQELGAGRNGKMHLQFTKRYWNESGSNGNTYADTGYQCTWDATRGQMGEHGILVNYT
ncbi:MAG TPA: FAD-dependent oxidoreductase, partial [Desulfobaccales bacterium]